MLHRQELDLPGPAQTDTRVTFEGWGATRSPVGCGVPGHPLGVTRRSERGPLFFPIGSRASGDGDQYGG